VTVYVDDMYQYPMGEFTNPRSGRKMKMSHMIADTTDELHAFAVALRLKREWFQGDHYDVSMSVRRTAIELGAVPITLRELAHMARKPRANKAGKQIAGLLAALKFVEPASKDIGQINQTHCMLSGNWVAAFDGLLMMAAKIDTDITAFPNTRRLVATLSKCDEAVQITQLDNNRLGIKSGKFSAFVPCIEPGLLAFTPPDAPQWQWNDGVTAALSTVGIIAKENAPRMVQASILLRENSAAATDGVMAFEYWHGTPMPTVVLPKVFVSELIKIGKKPVQCGASQSTFTVYFEDESFIRTQLYTDPYPNIDKVLGVAASPYPIPAELWSALEKLDAMKSDKHRIYFNAKGSKLQTDIDDNIGASYDFEHPMPDGVMFNIDLLRRFAPFAKTADWVCGDDGKMSAFYGDQFRGVLMSMRVDKTPPVQQPAPGAPTLADGYTPADINPAWGTPGHIEQAVSQMPGANSGDLDDEIPF
jgi:hypothetical protein